MSALTAILEQYALYGTSSFSSIFLHLCWWLVANYTHNLQVIKQ